MFLGKSGLKKRGGAVKANRCDVCDRISLWECYCSVLVALLFKETLAECCCKLESLIPVLCEAKEVE